MDRPDLDRLPTDPRTGEPLPPRAQPGYYPGYSTLAQQDFWDDATRQVVLHRVRQVPPIRFFSEDQARLMRAILDRILPQDDRDEEHRIPVLNFIDERLYTNRGDGYRYESMPPDREAFLLGMQGIEAIAHHRHQQSFVALGPTDQDEILKSLHDAKPDAGQEIWERVPPHRFFLMLLQDACEAYYAHPWAWDEIGYGGPAYPRGYMRLEGGQPEPWEKPEKRYQWKPPPSARSAEFKHVGGSDEHYATPGQGGSH